MYRLAKEYNEPFLTGERNGTIFDRSTLKVRFMYWVSFYDMILGLPASERPAERIIEDNGLLDAWWEAEIKRREAKQKGNVRPSKSSGKAQSETRSNF